MQRPAELLVAQRPQIGAMWAGTTRARADQERNSRSATGRQLNAHRLRLTPARRAPKHKRNGDCGRENKVAAQRRYEVSRESLLVAERTMTSILHEIPASERPRERLKSHGPRALSSAELLAILVGSGSRGNSAVGIGHEILASARGSLRRLSAQPVATLT